MRVYRSAVRYYGAGSLSEDDCNVVSSAISIIRCAVSTATKLTRKVGLFVLVTGIEAGLLELPVCMEGGINISFNSLAEATHLACSL